MSRIVDMALMYTHLSRWNCISTYTGKYVYHDFYCFCLKTPFCHGASHLFVSFFKLLPFCGTSWLLSLEAALTFLDCSSVRIYGTCCFNRHVGVTWTMAGAGQDEKSTVFSACLHMHSIQELQYPESYAVKLKYVKSI